jgi:3-isopropylmalate dehydrogenase
MMIDSAPEKPEQESGGFLSKQIGLNGPAPKPDAGRRIIGILEGEGIGPEVVRAAVHVLDALSDRIGIAFELRRGGPIGHESLAHCGQVLSNDVAAFIHQVFAEGGAILSGPGGGRFVYEARRRFDLYCKLCPLKPCPEVIRGGRLRARYVRGVDILLVRDNSGGIYQGHWKETASPSDGRVAEHTFSYTENQVRRIVQVGAQLARQRSGRMTVIVKDDGIPSVTRLWRDVAGDIADRDGVDCFFLNVDHAAYRLVQHAGEFDVVVAPNLFGDVLADLGGVLLGSRALSYSGNLGPDGRAVYQTNHGSAFDLAGTDRANPVGQIFSLAMLLRESFGLKGEADLIENAVRLVWRLGWRSADLAEPRCRIVGTQELADRIAQAVTCLGARETVS